MTVDKIQNCVNLAGCCRLESCVFRGFRVACDWAVWWAGSAQHPGAALVDHQWAGELRAGPFTLQGPGSCLRKDSYTGCPVRLLGSGHLVRSTDQESWDTRAHTLMVQG